MAAWMRQGYSLILGLGVAVGVGACRPTGMRSGERAVDGPPSREPPGAVPPSSAEPPSAPVQRSEPQLRVALAFGSTAGFSLLAGAAVLLVDVPLSLATGGEPGAFGVPLLLTGDGVQPPDTLLAGLEAEDALGRVWGRWPDALWLEAMQLSHGYSRGDTWFVAHQLRWDHDHWRGDALLPGLYSVAGAAFSPGVDGRGAGSLVYSAAPTPAFGAPTFRWVSAADDGPPPALPTFPEMAVTMEGRSSLPYRVHDWQPLPDGGSIAVLGDLALIPCVARWSPRGGLPELEPLPPELRAPSGEYAIAALTARHFWLSGNGKLWEFDDGRWAEAPATSSGTTVERPPSLFGIREGRLWVASSAGLFASRGGAFERVAAATADDNGTSVPVAYSGVWVAPTGTLWATAWRADDSIVLLTNAPDTGDRPALARSLADAVARRRAVTRCQSVWGWTIASRRVAERPLEVAHATEIARLARAVKGLPAELQQRVWVADLARPGGGVVALIADTHAAAAALTERRRDAASELPPGDPECMAGALVTELAWCTDHFGERPCGR